MSSFGVGGCFSAAAAAQLAGTSVNAASLFLRRLAEIGALKRLHKRARDSGWRYALTCDLGVKTPVLASSREGSVVYDPNARHLALCASFDFKWRP